MDSGAPTTAWSSPEGSALVTAGAMGRRDIISLLLDRGADINAVGGEYGTVLTAAASQNLDLIMERLLDRGADINAVGGKYGTALAAAASQGYTHSVLMLLDRGADINMVCGEYGTALAAAAFAGRVYTMPVLLDRGADINVVSDKYGTALAVAALARQLEAIRLLLDRGADTKVVGGKYGTALAAAAFGGGLKCTTLLLDRGAEINAVSGEYGTALIAAAFRGYGLIVGRLLDRGADINTVGGEYGTALAAAAFKGEITTVSLLVDRGADINAASSNYGTALAIAAFKGFDLIVELLIDRGADINAVGGRYGTALGAAACHGLARVVSLLLDRGANINLVGGEYGTPLAAAAFWGIENIVRLLLDHGADTRVVSGQYGTALATAVFKGFEPIVELLLDRGAEINMVGDEYETALATAASKGSVSTIELLLDRGANINAVGGKYGTALAAAALKGFESIVNMLLDRGADINVVGGKYGTALAAAALKASNPTVILLLDRGAEINAVGGEYGTALAAAASKGFTSTTELLLKRGADINMVGGTYGTALAAAAFWGLPRITQLLLDRGAETEVAGGEYGTALAAAAFGGHTQVVSKLLKHGADIMHAGGRYSTATATGKGISRPPFPMPYTGGPYHHRGPLLSSLSFSDIVPTEFYEGSSITSEHADIPCLKLNEKALWNALTALVGVDEATKSQAKHEWIQYDVDYFVAHHFDFGLAYAAARVAWRDFMRHSMDSSIILIERSQWHQHAQALDEARSKAIEVDHRQELIIYPYSILPRRLWDLKSNRVIDFQMLHAALSNIKTLPTFWAVSHSWTNDMSPVWTAINQYQWPVLLPKNIGLDYLRSELLTLGAEYVWLDVVCLRQKGDDSHEQLRQQEWKLDVPTIGNIYRAATRIVRYFNGLGIRFSTHGWDDPRHWLQRAWTLQEIKTENTTINGGISRDPDGRQVFLNSQGKVSGAIVKFRSALRPVIQLAAQVDSSYGCEIYELAREMAKRHASQPLDKLSGLFYLLGTTKLPCYNEQISSEDFWRQCFHLLPAERKAEILFDFPYRGSDDQWFPNWAQVLDWPTRDPEYEHMRPQSSRHLVKYFPKEKSFIIRNLWTISNVVLCETNFPGEYKAEIGKGLFGFYLPYIFQKPIDIQDQRFTLATMDLGHAYNWVVCKAIGKRAGRVASLVGVAHLNVLSKVGVLRTDSCSDLMVGGENGTSLLQKMHCLFI